MSKVHRRIPRRAVTACGMPIYSRQHTGLSREVTCEACIRATSAWWLHFSSALAIAAPKVIANISDATLDMLIEAMSKESNGL